MEIPSLKCKDFEQSAHFKLKTAAFDHFLKETSDVDEATKMANIVYNVRVLRTKYAPFLQNRAEEFIQQFIDANEP